MAEQEDMKRKRILLTAREKHGIGNYCFQRRELCNSINITKFFLLKFLYLDFVYRQLKMYIISP
jgi:hypothetical protein